MQKIIQELKRGVQKVENNFEDKYEILEKIISNKIESHDIKIKPKWHFVLKGLVIILSAIFLFLLSIFFLSFVIFKNRMLPPHAMQEVFMNMQILPFVLSSILLFILAIIFILHTKYNFVYKKPAYIIIFSLLFVILISSFFIDKLLMHDMIRDRMERRPMPFIRDMYRNNSDNSLKRDILNRRDHDVSENNLGNIKFEIK